MDGLQNFSNLHQLLDVFSLALLDKATSKIGAVHHQLFNINKYISVKCIDYSNILIQENRLEMS